VRHCSDLGSATPFGDVLLNLMTNELLTKMRIAVDATYKEQIVAVMCNGGIDRSILTSDKKEMVYRLILAMILNDETTFVECMAQFPKYSHDQCQASKESSHGRVLVEPRRQHQCHERVW